MLIDRLIVNVLEWAAGHHDEGRWSPVAIVFHWTMAVLIFFQLGWGWWAGRLPVGGDKIAAYELHFSVGLVMLTLVILRFGWRLLAPGPINDADKPGWQTAAASVTHWVFYASLFALPISGWMMLSATAREQGLTVFGFLSWPLLPLQDLSHTQAWAVEAAAEWVHWALVVSLLVLIPVHVGGALKHHLIDRDDVLHGMLPVLPLPSRRRTRWQRRWRALEQRVRSRATQLWPALRRR